MLNNINRNKPLDSSMVATTIQKYSVISTIVVATTEKVTNKQMLIQICVTQILEGYKKEDPPAQLKLVVPLSVP